MRAGVPDRTVAPGVAPIRRRLDGPRGPVGAARSAPAATKTACVTPQPPPSPSQTPTIGTLEASPVPDAPAPEGSGDTSSTVVIIGAGPGRPHRRLQLAKHGVTDSIVLEADDVVGGISRTVERDGWRFDIGGHRFFTKVPEVEALWHEILPDGQLPAAAPHEPHLLRRQVLRLPAQGLQRPAQPRRGRGGEVRRLLRLGPGPTAEGHRPTSRAGWPPASAGASTASSSRPTPRRSGACRPPSIQADWAAQRIKNLSLGKAIINSLLPKRGKTDVTSLIEEFQYPMHGPGMMWERCPGPPRRGRRRGPDAAPGDPDRARRRSAPPRSWTERRRRPPPPPRLRAR